MVGWDVGFVEYIERFVTFICLLNRFESNLIESNLYNLKRSDPIRVSNPSVYLSICLSVYLSIYLSTYLSFYHSIDLSM